MSFSELVKNAAQLDMDEYEKFIAAVNKMRAKQNRKSTASKKEVALLEKINKGFSNKKWQRLQLLDLKMEEGNLADSESTELAALTDAYEKYSVKRIRLLKKLAVLRHTTLEEVMLQLGLNHGKV